ncbi:MAG: dTDP-4-dehydrorhamnose 3,5-epimerase [Bacteroidetes bacterium]|jgi:dTDP-4-dehydrorhamnose 3,5-epimerase|nr:dTDP-4-dehydrorhamnose 3,5-epimerase [Bacteroidota bacterium]MBT3747704.1 dTDP-4-dehydrorhamnose 3,5-epimerase [Bacteroidota bacterium]MBT4398454.1 dTDP-4-dehydrorhamnose 3,5-epimerase [Bacteroidota bacterium]MBT4411949.1 dTDP-4-dehydrorhamnose 3,5-epimerase [Bacteroidota bacterium]MBT5427765.1 dTDP-4-dehydrorhamnose 3,5-epimerase [Bacteroidota bacterium]
MKIIETGMPGLLILEPRVFEDSRGYFFESYNVKTWQEHGIEQDFVQDNQSKSNYGVVRGLHYQLAPYSQTKMVRVLHGEVLDVAVDIRQGSPTFGECYSIILSAENKKQLLIPKGFAHGFSVISESAIFYYKCDEVYHPEAERGILYKDSKLAIDWMIPKQHRIISDKDEIHPVLTEAEMNFRFD